MKEHKIDIKELFKEMETLSPSDDFSAKVMEQINVEAKQQQERKRRLNIILIACGVAGFVGLQVGLYFLFDISIGRILYPVFNSFSSFAIEFSANSTIVMVAVAAILLLLIDMMVREQIRVKHTESQ